MHMVYVFIYMLISLYLRVILIELSYNTTRASYDRFHAHNNCNVLHCTQQ